jgi:CRP/FNR family cyclic AMP-dependent transcriptional regulator
MPAAPELLESVPFFQTMDNEERAAVATLMTQVHVSAGKLMFRENDPGGVLYVVTRGRVELSVIDDDREKLVLDIVEPGDFFGEMSLLDGGMRSTTAIALEDVVAYSLERGHFLDLLRRRSDAALDVMTALARRVRKTDVLLRRRVRNANEVAEEQETFGDHVADGVARFGGSWRFIFAFGAFLLLWVLANTVLAYVRRHEPFDPYPFILLNLFLSMLAAIQAPVIMMSQNRQDTKDRIRSELDYRVNLKAELEIMQLHEKVEALREEILSRLDR